MRRRWFDVPRLSRGDVVAGVTVATILIPQSLAYAVLAGVPPGIGLLVAVVAGITAAPFASSPFLQTGPVAITALLAFGALAPLEAPGSERYVGLAATLAVMVGLVRLVIGVFRAGDIAYLMSEPVVLGFTAGAAAVIIATQVPSLLGVTTVEGGPILSAVRALADVDSWHWPTLAMGVGSLVFLLAARRFARRFPLVILVVVGSLVIARVADYSGEMIGLLPALRPALAGLPGSGALTSLIVPALVIAIIGFGDVAAISRTYATERRMRWDADREFVSQGVANIASGLVGGFPVGGSFSRTAVAVEAGARSAWTGAVASLVVLVTLPIAGVMRTLPTATLAAIIVASVVGLTDIRPVLALRRYSRQQFVIASSTFVLALVMAPEIQWALVVGIVLAIGAHLRRELLIGVPFTKDGDVIHLHPTGVLFFASAHRLIDRMRSIIVTYDVSHLVLHLDRLGRVDVTGAIALRDFIREAAEAGITVELTDATAPSLKILQRVIGEDAPGLAVSALDAEDEPG